MYIFLHPPSIEDGEYNDELHKELDSTIIGSFEIMHKNDIYFSCTYNSPTIIDFSQFSSFFNFEDIENISLSPLVPSQESNVSLAITEPVITNPDRSKCPKYLFGYPVSQLLPSIDYLRTIPDQTTCVAVNLLVMILQVLPLEIIESSVCSSTTKNRILVWVADPTFTYFPIYIWNVISGKNNFISSLKPGQILFWTNVFLKSSINDGTISGHATQNSKIIQYGSAKSEINNSILQYFLGDYNKGKNEIKDLYSQFIEYGLISLSPLTQ